MDEPLLLSLGAVLLGETCPYLTSLVSRCILHLLPLLFTQLSLCLLSESFTADHKPLMGEAPEVRGFFLGCGFNSAGK